MTTPDDVAAIRTAHSLKCCCDRCALCDALTAAWAERDEWHDSHTHWRTEFKAMRERAERAEALLAVEQLHDTYTPEGTEAILRELREANAALARVRALCDKNSGDGFEYKIKPSQVRAAIEGDNQ